MKEKNITGKGKYIEKNETKTLKGGTKIKR